MAVAVNADLYAEPRQNIFFPGVTPDLDGQCVSLVKWFMQEMSGVPNPQAARGDARYVGNTLVAQGQADEVPYADRKRGDLICYEYGQYGHIAVQLSDGRVFEQNVNIGGVKSEVVDGATVYASRIGSENELWRSDKNPHVYRLKTYSDGGNNMTRDQAYQQALLARTGIDFVTVEEANTHAEDDANHILADPGYLGAMMAQLKNGANWAKASDWFSHGDERVEEAYQKGLSEGGSNCTPDERAFLDTMYKVVIKKG